MKSDLDFNNTGKNEPSTQVNVGGAVVSMQTVQHIYNEITGRTEELSRRYKINHCVSFEDLEQLNIKINQMLEQYNIAGSSGSITLYHHDDQKQVFSSFERFRLYDRTTLSPIENIRLEYNFLIILPQVNKPQPYSIEINIFSRAAIVQRANAETIVPPGMFLEVLTNSTGHLEIKYVDYTVARNFQVAIDSWFKALKQHPDLAWIRFIQRHSEYIPFSLRTLSISIYLYSCITILLPTLTNVSVSGGALYRAVTVTLGGTTLLSLIMSRIGSTLVNAVRRIQPLSCLQLTRGDENALTQLQSSNNKSLLKGGVSTVIAVFLNLLSSWLAAKLGLGQ